MDHNKDGFFVSLKEFSLEEFSTPHAACVIPERVYTFKENYIIDS